MSQNITVIYADPNQNPNPTTTQYYNAQKSSWRNRPQSAATSAASLIFLAGGMNLALGLGWNLDTRILNTEQFQFSWFIGFIAGAILAAPLVRLLPQKIAMISSAILIIAAGILFTSAPYNYRCILAGRYLNGIGTGFATVSFLVYGGEIAAIAYRGTCVAIEQLNITFGIFVQVIYASEWTYDNSFASNRVNGIISIVLGLLAFGAVAAIIESPIYYIRKDNEAAALESLRCLQNPVVLTDDKKARFDELRNYVIENESYTYAESCMNSLGPLLKMLLFRGVVALSFSLPLSVAVQMGAFVSMGYTNSWVLVVFPILRLLGAFISYWIMDGIGRKCISLLGLLVMAGMILGVGILFKDEANLLDTHKMSIVCTLSLLGQFFAGLFVTSTSVYLSEAFPMMAKPYFISFCVIVEQIVHIIVICTFEVATEMRPLYIYCIASAVIMFALWAFSCVTMPETRSTQLREAQARFKRWLNLQFF